MPNTDIFNQVRDIFSGVMGVAPDRIVMEATPDTIESWDSLRLLNLVLACEEAFSITLDPEEVERMTSVRAVVETISRKV
jgi:acyl carrier protein